MPGYNFNHFTGKTKDKALRKKKGSSEAKSQK